MTTETSMSLDTIETETGFTVFETDQVLTPAQLNSVADYLDDQERLTRVALLGVGIACGLWPSLPAAGSVRLSHGVGTTTDGDLVFMPGATRYEDYKPYDASAPKYPPFQSGGSMIAAFELVPKDKAKDDSRAKPLAGFDAAEAPRKLQEMATVLYVESYLHDPDLCEATDCDNRGKNWIHATRLLLVDAKSAAALAGTPDTPDRAARTALAPVVIARPVLRGTLAVEADLAAAYRKACDAIHKTLLPALGSIYRACGWFLRDIASSDPAPRWQKALDALRETVPVRGTQYYYDFLKDVAETYNAFRNSLFGDTAVCCPDLGEFPKHLVLGSLDPAQRAAVGRTGFYPSPMVSERFERRAHARFLIRKLDALIRNFAVPGPGQIRITPSAFEDRPLEERAIPFYYQPQIHLAWSHALSNKGMERYAYSYNAGRYNALGGAKEPFAAQIGAFGFFRIEGHFGWNVRDAAKRLRDEIRAQNLPIDVETVLLGSNPGKVVFDPPWRHQPLYWMRHLARADVELQLDEAGKYGTSLAVQIGKAVDGKVIQNADVGEGVEAKGLAANMGNEFAGQAQKLMLMLDQDTAQEGFRQAATKTMGFAADMHVKFSPVTKKEFASPFDSLIDARSMHWLTWLDTLIKDADGKETQRLLLAAYLEQHPGLEHCAGVLRGGTFVLVHDENDIVVADFMLPYSCCERRGQPLPPPHLVPLPKPPLVVDGPVRIIPFPDKFRFEKFRDDFVQSVQKDIDLKTNYFTTFKDAVGIFVGGKAGGSFVPGGTFQPGFLATDTLLDLNRNDMIWKTQKVDMLRERLLDTSLDEAKRTAIQDQLDTAETELASAIVTTTEYVAKAGIDVTPGSDGAKAMGAASGALAKVSNIDALAGLEKGLTRLGGNAATAPEVKAVIGNLLAGRGIR